MKQKVLGTLHHTPPSEPGGSGLDHTAKSPSPMADVQVQGIEGGSDEAMQEVEGSTIDDTEPLVRRSKRLVSQIAQQRWGGAPKALSGEEIPPDTDEDEANADSGSTRNSEDEDGEAQHQEDSDEDELFVRPTTEVDEEGISLHERLREKFYQDAAKISTSTSLVY